MNTGKPICPTIPEISIIVTAYNVANYIEQAVYSVVEGTLEQNCELIVIDDGSTDGTRQIIERIAGEFQCIRIILFKKNTPGGVGRAANAGIAAATGKFIGFLDGDDIVLPHTFDRLLTKIKAENSDIALCDYEMLYEETGGLEKSGDWDVWNQISQKKNYNGEEVKELLKLQVYPWRKLYKSSFLEEHALRFPEVDCYFEDALFHWRVCLAAKSATICNFSGFHYRYDRPGQTSNPVARIRKQALDYAPEIKELVKQNNCQQCNDAFLKWYFGTLAWIAAPSESGYAKAMQQEVSEILNEYTAMRIAAMLRRVPYKRRVFLPLTRSFSAVIWLRLGVPYMFRRRVEIRSVTLIEALFIWGLILISSRN